MQIYIQQQTNPQTFQGINIPKTELKALLEKGNDIEEIAQKFNVSGRTIRNRIKEYNLLLPSAKLKKTLQNEVLPLLEQGFSSATIHKLTGIPKSYIITSKHENDIPPFQKIREKRIIELFNQNKTDREIANILNMSESTVTRRRQRLGCKKINGRYALLKNTPVLDDIKSGASMKDIVNKYQVSVNTVTNYVSKNNELTPKKLEIKNKQLLIDDYLYQGYTVKQIAEEMGVKNISIYHFIQRYLPEWIGHINK